MAATNGASNGKRKSPRKTSTGTGKPAWQRLTKRQLAAAIELRREGFNRQQITARLRLPAGALRARMRFDPLFEADFQAAQRESYSDKGDALLDRMWSIAMTDDEHGLPHASSLRACHQLANVFSPDYRNAQVRQRVELTGKDGGPLEHRLFDPTKLSDEDLDALDALLGRAAVDG